MLSNITLDNTTKVATVFIAIFNVFFTVRIFYTKDKKESLDKEKDRKIQLLKTLILDHNLKHFYDIFDSLNTELAVLKNQALTEEDRAKIGVKIDDLFILFRRNFYDIFLAVDLSFYEKIKVHIDNLQSQLSGSIFDSGINLSHLPKFDEVISEKLSEAKTLIIKEVYSFRG